MKITAAGLFLDRGDHSARAVAVNQFATVLRQRLSGLSLLQQPFDRFCNAISAETLRVQLHYAIPLFQFPGRGLLIFGNCNHDRRKPQ